MRDLHTRNRGMGFTLLELSVVVLVVTLLVGGLLIPLSTQVEQRNVSDTQQRLAQVQDALIGFAIAHGRFPCPATVSTPPQPTDLGVEDPPTGTGICTHPIDGYVPGTTLGLTNLDNQGFVLDAWGLQQNRIRYSITPALTNAFTTPNGMRTAGIAALGNSANTYLYVCVSATGTTTLPPACSTVVPPANDPNALSRGDAVFAIYSLGKNAGTTGGTSADEALNVKSTTNTSPVFVSKTVSGQTGSEFDDIMVWGSRYNVVSRLTAAGQLP